MPADSRTLGRAGDEHGEPFLVTLLPSTDVDLGRWLLQHYGVSRLLPEEAGRREQVIAAGHEYRFGMGLGVVDWAYYHLLPHRRLTHAAFTSGVPWFEKLLVPIVYPLIRGLMTRVLQLSPAKAEQGLAAVYAEFDRVDARLADGREFLYGEHLSYADLAFAAAAAPMVLAHGYGGHLPAFQALTPPMRQVIGARRERPDRAFIQRVYARYRLGAHQTAASKHYSPA